MPEPIRIAHCTWSGDVGGAERALHLLTGVQARDPRTAPALLFARGGLYADRARDLGLPLVVLGARGASDLRVLPRAVRFLRGHDVHHFHGIEPVLMLASLLCPGSRRVFTQRAGPEDPARFSAGKRLRYRAVRLELRRFHAFSGNTAHAIEAAHDFFGIERERVRVTYNGLEFDLLEPRRPAAEVRAELGIAGGDWVLGTAAVLKDWKRIDRLVRAAAAVDRPRLRLLICGDGPERHRLEALARECGVADRVIFAGLQAHIGDYLQVMDAFSLPSNHQESFGNGVVEAMAMGLPSIVFADSGGMREHVGDGETGIVAADQAGLEAAIARLHDDAELAARLGAAGRAYVRSTYTPEKAAERYLGLYREALTGSAATASGT